MKTLKFIVDGPIIKKDPTCNFADLVPGSNGYLKAEFSFSNEWDECARVAAFYSPLGKEYTPQILYGGKICDIPFEALEKRSFKVQVVGRRADGFKIKTNKVTVSQNGGKE